MTWLMFLVAVGIAFMPSVPMAAAQTDTLRIRSSVVNPAGELSAVVEFPPGPLPKSSDFGLLIDDRRVASGRETQNQRLNLMFLVDVSGSMQGAPLNDIKAALPKFLKTARPDDQFALTLFGDDDRLESNFDQPRENIEAALTKVQARDKQTKLYRALHNAIRQGATDDPQVRRIIVVLTDGKDEGSDVTLEQVVAEAKARLIPIYAIFRGKTDKPFKDVLTGLANSASGHYVFTSNENDIARALDRIYGLETSSATVAFAYAVDPTGRVTDKGAIELRRPDGSVLRAALPEKIPALRLPPPPTRWPVVPLLLLLAVVVAAGAIWLWRRRPEEVSVPPAEPPMPTPPPVEPREVDDRPSPPSRETVIIGRYFPPPSSGRPAVLLRGIAGPAAGQEHAMEQELVSIGANAASDMQIVHDEYVSGEHAYLRYEQGSLFIFDKASRNGTFVNNNKVPGNGTVLRPGDQVTLGSSTFSVVMPDR